MTAGFMAPPVMRWWDYHWHRSVPLLLWPGVAMWTVAGQSIVSGLAGRAQSVDATVAALMTLVAVALMVQLHVADDLRRYDRDLAHRPDHGLARGAMTRHDAVLLTMVLGVAQLGLIVSFWPAGVPTLILAWAAVLGLPTLVGMVERSADANRPMMAVLAKSVAVGTVAAVATMPVWVSEPIAMVGLVALIATAAMTMFGWHLADAVASSKDISPGDPALVDLWPPSGLVIIWLIVMMSASSFFSVVAVELGTVWQMSLILNLAALVAVAVTVRFLLAPGPRRGRFAVAYARAWAVTIPSTLGIAPLLQ